MVAPSKKTRKLSTLIEAINLKQKNATTFFEKLFFSASFWVLMVIRELVKDDAKIRAESLSFLMVFSLPPLIAGAVFLFNILSHFGLAQAAIQNIVQKFLETFPEEHRQILQEYLTQLIESYWTLISQKSTSIGVFSVFVLLWVGLATFNNIDKTLNFIWSSYRERSLGETFRNYLVVVVLAPLVLTGAFSLPLIFIKTSLGTLLVSRFPLLPILLNALLFPALTGVTFLLIYKYIPVCTVHWKSASVGALTAASALQVVNFILQIYFKHGTASVYGKAAVIPIVMFWMFLLWLVFLVGAEVSYLVQSGYDPENKDFLSRTLDEAKALLHFLVILLKAHKYEKKALTLWEIKKMERWDFVQLQKVIEYCLEKNWIVRGFDKRGEETYVLAWDVGSIMIQRILEDYLGVHQSKVKQEYLPWTQSIKHWLSFFENSSLVSLLDPKNNPALNQS